MRAMIAIGIVQRAREGRIRCAKALLKAVQFKARRLSKRRRPLCKGIEIMESIRPEKGSHPKKTEKRKISMRPNQKTGIETPKRAINIATVSKMEFLLQADIIPAGIPIIRARIIAKRVNSKVAGNLLAISLATGVLDLIDFPVSPWKSFIHINYILLPERFI